MAEQNSPPPLRAVIGERLRSLREDRGERQEDLATTARLAGLDWSRSTVAGVETGRREVGLEELLMIAFAYRVPLSYFFEGDGWVSLAPGASARRSVIRAKLNGDATRWSGEDWDVPANRIWPEVLTLLKDYRAVYEWLWPDHETGDLFTAADAAKGEAERSVAARFGVQPMAVSMAAFGRWGRGFTAERDQRVAEQAPADASPRTLQALRGHVSRALMDEIAADMRRVTNMPPEQIPSSDELLERIQQEGGRTNE